VNPNKIKSNSKKNIIITTLIIIAIGLLSFIIYKKINVQNEDSLDLFNLSYKNTFYYVENKDDDVYRDYSTGIVEVKGYAEVVKRDGIPDDEYVFFHIIESSSSDFLNYIKSLYEFDPHGYYIREDAIGIGCLEDNIISMIRFADKYNEENLSYKLSLDDSKKILSSSKDKPVSIIFRKDYDSNNDPVVNRCSSKISSIELIK
jgi:hypothetical protein